MTVRQTPESKCLRGCSYLRAHAKPVFLSGNVNSWVNSCIFLKDCCSQTTRWRNTSILSFNMSFMWVTNYWQRELEEICEYTQYPFILVQHFILFTFLKTRSAAKERETYTSLAKCKAISLRSATWRLLKLSGSLVTRAGNCPDSQSAHTLNDLLHIQWTRNYRTST